jgi:hypothetical protein
MPALPPCLTSLLEGFPPSPLLLVYVYLVDAAVCVHDIQQTMLLLLLFLLLLLPIVWAQLPDPSSYHQQPQQRQGMRASRSCGNLAFMASGQSGGMDMAGMQGHGSGMHPGSLVHSPPLTSQPQYGR